MEDNNKVEERLGSKVRNPRLEIKIRGMKSDAVDDYRRSSSPVICVELQDGQDLRRWRSRYAEWW